jgi:hypothetical protein
MDGLSRLDVRTVRHSKVSMTNDDPWVRACGIPFALDLGLVEMGSLSKMAVRRRCAEIASVPFGGRSADWSSIAEGGSIQPTRKVSRSSVVGTLAGPIRLERAQPPGRHSHPYLGPMDIAGTTAPIPTRAHATLTPGGPRRGRGLVQHLQILARACSSSTLPTAPTLSCLSYLVFAGRPLPDRLPARGCRARRGADGGRGQSGQARGRG